MRYSPISIIQPGAVLGRDVTLPGVGVLLRAGAELSAKDINILFDYGIHYLYIDDALTVDAIPQEMILDATRVHAVDEVYKVLTHYDSLDDKKSNDLKDLVSIGEKMVEEICSSKQLKISTNDLRGYDDYTFRHSVNVTAISLVIGRAMNFTRKELNELALAGLLHDIGKMTLAPSILNKKGRLDDFEFSQIKRHPNWGYEILSEKTNTSPRVWAVAMQHHETLDGGGYPQGKKLEQIHPWARIVTIADIWDALRSERPYKSSWTTTKSIELLKSEEMKSKLDKKFLAAFLEHIVSYPNGSLVQLSTREFAVVLEQHENDDQHPIVKVITAPDGHYYSRAESQIIDLAADKDCTIQRIVG